MAGKKPAPAKFEEFSDDVDDESWDDAAAEPDAADSEQQLRLRDWRDVERYREMKELRQLVDDEDVLQEIFEIPTRPRVSAELSAALSRRPARPDKNAARPQEKAPHKPVAKKAPKPAPKVVPKKAKAKRR
jgi:hypothetical protein